MKIVRLIQLILLFMLFACREKHKDTTNSLGNFSMVSNLAITNEGENDFVVDQHGKTPVNLIQYVRVNDSVFSGKDKFSKALDYAEKLNLEGMELLTEISVQKKNLEYENAILFSDPLLLNPKFYKGYAGSDSEMRLEDGSVKLGGQRRRCLKIVFRTEDYVDGFTEKIFSVGYADATWELLKREMINIHPNSNTIDYCQDTINYNVYERTGKPLFISASTLHDLKALKCIPKSSK